MSEQDEHATSDTQAGEQPEAPAAAAEASVREGARPGATASPYAAAGAAFTA